MGRKKKVMAIIILCLLLFVIVLGLVFLYQTKKEKPQSNLIYVGEKIIIQGGKEIKIGDTVQKLIDQLGLPKEIKTIGSAQALYYNKEKLVFFNRR